MTTDEARQPPDARLLAAPAHPPRRRLRDARKVHDPGTAGSRAATTGPAVVVFAHGVPGTP
ncbi:hypothetical protein Ate01nite_35460 [Actinoplanes teichomyceticus]|nr:hypothetical protein Ate01nite_35460 [Actinoplanes teichomyceticus]